MIQFNKISSRKEVLEIVDNWYQRAHRLREVWENDEVPISKNAKAFMLWYQTIQRLIKLNTLISETDQKHAPDFPKGGIVSSNMEEFPLENEIVRYNRGLSTDKYWDEKSIEVLNPFANKIYIDSSLFKSNPFPFEQA